MTASVHATSVGGTALCSSMVLTAQEDSSHSSFLHVNKTPLNYKNQMSENCSGFKTVKGNAHQEQLTGPAPTGSSVSRRFENNSRYVSEV